MENQQGVIQDVSRPRRVGSHSLDTKIQTDKPSVQGAGNLPTGDDQVCARWNTVSLLKRQIGIEIGFRIAHIDIFFFL